MSATSEIVGRFLKIEFSTNVVPEFIEKKNKDYVFFGKDNNYPSFIVDLARQHPEHGAILKGKAKYVYGNGLTSDDVMAQSFLSRANRFEDWNSVYRKTTSPFEYFNGFAWQIVWNISGTSCEVYSMNFTKCRKSCDGERIFYCDKWVDDCGKVNPRPEQDPTYQEFDAFNPYVRKGTQVLYYVFEDISTTEHGDVYPVPEYIACVKSIATDVAVMDFQNALVTNGMSAQGMLSLFNGEPTEEEKKKYAKMFEKSYSGPMKAGKILFNFVDKGNDSKGAEYQTFSVSDQDKMFEQICKNNQQKIITGHSIPNKSLFGISVEGALSDRTAILESWEQYYTGYIIPRQNVILEQISMIASLCGVTAEIKVKRLAPIGVNVTDPNISKFLTEDEIRDKLGYGPKNADPVTGQPIMQGETNANLKGLTGTEWIHIKRLIREVQKGVTTREAASMLLKNAYQLTDEDLNVLFGQQQMSDDKFSLFEQAAQDDNDDEVVEKYYVYKFGTSKLANSILDLLKGNPQMPIEDMAKALGVDKEEIITAIAALVAAGLIASTADLTPTEKGVNKDVKPVETEVYTVYKYVTRQDVPEAEASRPFCKKMLKLSASGKVWTREAIDNISNSLGEDAWVYRGGFYTNPDTGETTPFCRHIWQAIVKTRVKK